MNFTKQDLQKISAYLGRQSVKDSQFSKVQSLKSDTGIPVLQSGENKMATIEQLISYLQSNMSLVDIPVNSTTFTARNLYDVLLELAGGGNGNGNGNGNGGNNTRKILSENVIYSYRIGSWGCENVYEALSQIFSILTGSVEYPFCATTKDINNIFN